MLYVKAKRYLGSAIWRGLIATLVIVAGLSQAHSQGLPSVLSGSRFLPVDDAFGFYASLPAAGVVAVNWEVAPGYYLYKNKFAFSVLENGVDREFSMSLPEASDHSDEFFGDVQVYFENLAVQLIFEGAPPTGEIV